MRVPGPLVRLFRRLTAAGEDHIFDDELAVFQAVLAAATAACRATLLRQLERYDRIDRSVDGSKQVLVDDDTWGNHANWPREILFPGEGAYDVAEVSLRHEQVRSATTKARLFMVDGRVAGCEFNRHHASRVNRARFKVNEAMRSLERQRTAWVTTRVHLLPPLSEDA